MGVTVFRKGLLKIPEERKDIEKLLKEIINVFSNTKNDIRIILEPTIPTLTKKGPVLVTGKPDLLILKDGVLVIVEYKAWKGEEILANLAYGIPWKIRNVDGAKIPYGDEQNPPHEQLLGYNDRLVEYIKKKYPSNRPRDLQQKYPGVSIFAWVVTKRDSVITDETEENSHFNGLFGSVRFDMFPANEFLDKLKYLGDRNDRASEVFDDIVRINKPVLVTDLRNLFIDRTEYQEEVQCRIPGLEVLLNGTEEEMERGMQIARDFNLRIYADEIFQIWKNSKNVLRRRTAMLTLINWEWKQTAIDSMLEESLSSGQDKLIDLSLEYFNVRGGEAKFLPPLLKLLESRNWKDKDKVLNALVRLNSREVPDILITRFEKTNSPPLLRMAESVEKDRRDSRIFRDRTEEEKGIERKHRFHKEFLQEWVENCPECRRECRGEIYSDRKTTALSIIKALGSVHSNKSPEFLRRFLTDLLQSIEALRKSDEENRYGSEPRYLVMSLAETATRSLIELHDTSASPVVMKLIESIADDDKDKFIRYYCDLAGKESIDALLRYTKSDDEWISAKAVQALADMKAKEKFDELFDLLANNGKLSNKKWLPKELVKALILLDPKRCEIRCLRQLMRADVSIEWKAFVLREGFYTVASRDSIEPLFRLMKDKRLREICVDILTLLYGSYPKDVRDGIERYLEPSSARDKIDSFYIQSDYYETNPEVFFDHELEYSEEQLRFILYTYVKSKRSNRVRKFLKSKDEKVRLIAWDTLKANERWEGNWKVFSTDEGAGESEMIVIDNTIILRRGSSIEQISSGQVKTCKILMMDGLNKVLEIKYVENGVEYRRLLFSEDAIFDSQYERIISVFGTVKTEDLPEDHYLDWYIWNSELFRTGPKTRLALLDVSIYEWYYRHTSCKIREQECNTDVFG